MGGEEKPIYVHTTKHYNGISGIVKPPLFNKISLNLDGLSQLLQE